MTDELPPGWARARVGEIIEARNGRAFKSTEWRKSGTPIIRIQNLKDAAASFNYFNGHLEEKHVVRSGDLLFAWSGTPGTSFGAHVWKGADAALNQHIFRIDFDRTAFSTAFLCHALNQNITQYIEQAQGGVGLAHITKTKFDDSLLLIPPANEQNRIIDRLDELFSRIDEGERALERVQKLMERYRQSVLKAAVTGELTREWREKNKDKLESGEALLARILKARREAWEKSELEKMKAKGITPANDKWKQKYEEPLSPDMTDPPELPDGWVWASLEMLADIVGGITVDQKRRTEDCEPVPYLRVANVQRGYLDLSEMKSINAPRDRIEQLRLRPGDILFNEGGDIDKLGRGWIWEGQLSNCIHQNHVFRARLVILYSLNKIISWYGNVMGRTLFMRLGKQTTNLASLSLSKLKSVPVPIMCPSEADEIVSRVDDILSITDHHAGEIEKQMRGSSSLRQGVLKAAFSGRLVSQDPADEPASMLLKRIAAGRGTNHAAPMRGRKKKTSA